MLSKMSVLGMAAVAVLLVSCSKDKKDAATTTTATAEKGTDTTVGEKAMTFNAEGSDSGEIAGLNTVNFAYDESSLSSSARSALAKNADWIKKHSEANIQIEGHCDDRGSVEYNLALGERRAKAARSYLVSLGVAAERLSIISYGKEKPLVRGDSEEAFARNRRANFVPIPR